MALNIKPIADRVVVEAAAAEEKTASGIYIPDTAKEKPSEGEIVAVGTGIRDDKGALVALEVKAGDTVLFGKWSGTEVTLDGEELLIIFLLLFYRFPFPCFVQLMGPFYL